MAQQIWKFQLSTHTPTTLLSTPKGTKFLTVQAQGDRWVVWGIVDHDEPQVPVFIDRIGTGFDMPELLPNEERIYLSTQQEFSMVWHFFVRQQKPCDTVTPDLATRNVTVRIRHQCRLPGVHWCELVDEVPTNVFAGQRYNDEQKCWMCEVPDETSLGLGSFGIVVRGPYWMGQEVVVPLSSLRIVKSGKCEDVGPVTID